MEKHVMAEVQAPLPNGAKKKRLSTRVDLTPMVDLGFLLITFFIFTATLSEASALKLPLPKDSPGDSSNVAASKTINLILGPRNQLWCHPGDLVSQARLIDYGPAGLRAVLQQKRQDLIRRFGTAKDMVVLIKPGPESSYKNLVDVLDEMLISDIGTHMLMEPSAQEHPLLTGNT